MSDYVTAATSLPRSLDVQISVSNPQTAVRRDMTLLCVVCEALGLLPNEGRIRFYSTLAGIENDYTSNSEPYRAGAAFFAQSPRAQTIAIAEAYLTAQKAQLVGAALTAAQILTLQTYTAGNLKVTVTSTRLR